MNSRHALLLVLLGAAGCAPPRQTAPNPPHPTVSSPNFPAPSTFAIAPLPETPTFSQTGLASWYGRKRQGAKTASGERFDKNAMTAAHRSLPLQTVARVTDLATGRSVKVRINDRGPHVNGRIIDLSSVAADALGMDNKAKVRVEVFRSDQSS